MESVFASLPDCVQIAILVIPSLSTIIAALGLFNNARQMKRSSKLMSSRIITDYLRRFVDDEDIQCSRRSTFTVKPEERLHCVCHWANKKIGNGGLR